MFKNFEAEACAGDNEAHVQCIWQGWKLQCFCFHQQGKLFSFYYWFLVVNNKRLYPQLLFFQNQAAKAAKIRGEYGLKKRVRAVRNVRGLTKLDMKLNDALPKIEVDPETYTVTADGEVLSCAPVTNIPLSRNYFLF